MIVSWRHCYCSIKNTKQKPSLCCAKYLFHFLGYVQDQFGWQAGLKNRFRSNLLSPLWVKLQWASESIIFTQEKNRGIRGKTEILSITGPSSQPETHAISSCYKAGPQLWGKTSSVEVILTWSRKWGEKYLFLFSPLSSILFMFPLHFYFPLYELILSNISPMPIELSAVTTDFSDAVHHCSQFSLTWTTVCSLRITGLIYKVMAYNMAFTLINWY